MGTLFQDFLIRPIITILVVIYQGLQFLHVPYALGFSIILLTVVIRLILYPIIASQLKASKKMQDLHPHLSKIKERHKGDHKRVQEETMKLYKEHGVNPAAGCLPMLIQLPIIWALYSVLQQIVGLKGSAVVSEINKLVYIDSVKLSTPWNQHFFGLPLGEFPSSLASAMPFIVLIPVFTGVFQLVQSAMMFPPKKATPKSVKKEDDFASAFQTQSLYIFPVMIGFFSYTLPIGLSLYWNTFTIFGILQQYQLQGIGGLLEWKNKLQTLWIKKKS